MAIEKGLKSFELHDVVHTRYSQPFLQPSRFEGRVKSTYEDGGKKWIIIEPFDQVRQEGDLLSQVVVYSGQLDRGLLSNKPPTGFVQHLKNLFS